MLLRESRSRSDWLPRPSCRSALRAARPPRLRHERSGRRIHRAIDRDAVALADHVVFLAVAGSGVDGAGALFQRDVVGQNAERIALQKRMPEDGAFQSRRRESARARSCPSRALRARASSRPSATMYDAVRRIDRDVFELRVETRWPCWPGWSTAWWSRSGRRPRGRRAPDRSLPGRTSARNAPRSTGWCDSRIRLRLRPARCGP